jgi:hypothetical protein
MFVHVPASKHKALMSGIERIEFTLYACKKNFSFFYIVGEKKHYYREALEMKSLPSHRKNKNRMWRTSRQSRVVKQAFYIYVCGGTLYPVSTRGGL